MSDKTAAALERLRATYDETRLYLRARERAETEIERLPKRLRDDPASVWMHGFSVGRDDALVTICEAIK